MTNYICKNCRYWDDRTQAPDKDEPTFATLIVRGISVRIQTGLCRIRAPQGMFPTTREDDWCGEFFQKRPC